MRKRGKLYWTLLGGVNQAKIFHKLGFDVEEPRPPHLHKLYVVSTSENGDHVDVQSVAGQNDSARNSRAFHQEVAEGVGFLRLDQKAIVRHIKSGQVAFLRS